MNEQCIQRKLVQALDKLRPKRMNCVALLLQESDSDTMFAWLACGSVVDSLRFGLQIDLVLAPRRKYATISTAQQYQ